MNKPPLCFLHGLTCDPSSWDGQRAHFRKAWRVLTPWLPLHGANPADAEATVEGLADALALRLRRDRHQSILIGHSLGGMVALHMALRAPDLVRGLVLADAFPSIKLNATVLSEFHAPRTSDAVRQRAATMMARGREQMGEALNDKLWQSIAAMDVTGRLGEVRAPVLGIYGGRGRYRSDQAAALRRALRLDRIPKCEVVILPDAGHFVQWENPAAFNAQVGRFASRVAQG
jgi:pimeloyl-ACP methyl ester carboxylesterase